MRSRRRVIWSVLVSVLLIGAVYAYWLYNKPHRNIETAEAMISITADKLFQHFIDDEQGATAQYADQVIEVKGVISSFDLSNNKEAQIVLETSDISGFIRCGFVEGTQSGIDDLKMGQEVLIKGECKGINAAEELDLLADKDVILSKCIIIE